MLIVAVNEVPSSMAYPLESYVLATKPSAGLNERGFLNPLTSIVMVSPGP